ncbi:tautomerase family protein [Trinickia mobilis]|uniref:tautomerase family protein n=1 Tax=Trinickia mobilis TaxID=2816356 RepID=UPI001A8EFD4C|nr:tautomerase family protein [Trinickia mobilis]
MPTYVCTATAGRLTPAQKAEIARSITDIHHEEARAARYFVLVFFQDVAPGSCYLGNQPGPADQIWIRGDIRAGRTTAQKERMLHRMMQDVSRVTGAPEDAVWVYLSDLPAENLTEYGRILPLPGQEEAWFSSLSEDLQERLKALA